jgi:hypothetical protein
VVNFAHHWSETVPDTSKVFLQFQYPAIVDLIKQVITLGIGTLVLSVAFVDKILDIHKASVTKRIVVALTWLDLTFSIAYGCFALEEFFVAGSLVSLQEDYSLMMGRAAKYAEASIVMYLIGLASLVLTGIYAVLSPTKSNTL